MCFLLKGFCTEGDLQLLAGGAGVSRWRFDTNPSYIPTLSLEGGGVAGHEGLNFPARDFYLFLLIVPNVLSYSLYEVAQSHLEPDNISLTGSVWIYMRPGLL